VVFHQVDQAAWATGATDAAAQAVANGTHGGRIQNYYVWLKAASMLHRVRDFVFHAHRVSTFLQINQKGRRSFPMRFNQQQIQSRQCEPGVLRKSSFLKPHQIWRVARGRNGIIQNHRGGCKVQYGHFRP
jgi:hypothetical protein